MASSAHSRKKVCYFYHSDIGNFYYGEGHPMKPHRIRVTHNLMLNYGLYKKMEVYQPRKETGEEMTKFHSDDYIRFLRSIRPYNMAQYPRETKKFNVGKDCPVFEGLYEFCQLSAGGSVGGALKLNKGVADIAINWAGGLHHAKKSEASGFCYVNDIVLAILELLKKHQRVLYIDIDVHHGDGVEEAFFTTDRVMTVSFHKYDGAYFPATGHLNDIGAGNGKYYAVNFPLKDGIDDESFETIFVPTISKVVETYQPSVIVMQCGADSLAGDRLGCFNLSVKGHAGCVEFVRKLNVPLLILGGGGYTIRNVARCWTYETAVALGIDIANEIPYTEFFDYYGPDYKLHYETSNMANQNSREYLESVKTRVFENLRMLPCAPGVQLQAIPEDGISVDDSEEEEKANPDERISVRASDKRVSYDNEFSDSDDEEDRRDQKNFAEGNLIKRRREEKEDNDAKNGSNGNEDAAATTTKAYEKNDSNGENKECVIKSPEATTKKEDDEGSVVSRITEDSDVTVKSERMSPAQYDEDAEAIDEDPVPSEMDDTVTY